MSLRAYLTVPPAIEASLNPGFIVIRTFADGKPEPFSEHLPRAGDDAQALATVDRVRAESVGVSRLEVVGWDGDTGRARFYTALIHVEHEGWNVVAFWRAPETDA